MQTPKDKNYLDITLAELALQYMIKKGIKLTTGNLFWIMERICKKIDRINKNTDKKLINFASGHCEFIEK